MSQITRGQTKRMKLETSPTTLHLTLHAVLMPQMVVNSELFKEHKAFLRGAGIFRIWKNGAQCFLMLSLIVDLNTYKPAVFDGRVFI